MRPLMRAVADSEPQSRGNLWLSGGDNEACVFSKEGRMDGRKDGGRDASLAGITSVRHRQVCAS